MSSQSSPSNWLERWRAEPHDLALLEKAISSCRRHGLPVPTEMLDACILPQHRFEARVELDVFVERRSADSPLGETEQLRSTPSKDGLGVLVPPSRQWFVKPRRLRDVVGAVAAIIDSPSPGLSLERLGVQDPDLRHVADVAALRWLSLARNNALSADGLRHLVPLTSLQTLDLGRCKGLTQLGHLASLPRLAAIRLDTVVHDAQIATLQPLPALTSLHLSNGKLTGTSLGDLVQLDTLVLRQCRKLTPAGMTSLGPALRRLDMAGHSNIDDLALASLTRATELTALSLRGCRKVSDAGLQNLAHMPLTQLDVSRCPRVDGSGLRALSPGLQRLNLADTAVSDDALRHALRPTLTALDVSRCPLTPVSLPDIGALPQLNALRMHPWMGGTTISGDAAAEMAAGLPLTHLGLQGFEDLGREGLAHLLAHRDLRVLELDGTLRTIDGGLDSLATLHNLRELGLNGVSELAASSGLRWLQGMQALQSLRLADFGEGINDIHMGSIAGLSGLRSLDISGARLTASGWRALSELHNLRHLRVVDVPMDAESLRALPEQLQTLTVRSKDDIDAKRLRQLCPACRIQSA